MTFESILFETSAERGDETLQPPDFFTDLNLDQIVEAITAGKDDYNLKPFFFDPLTDVAAVEYRHQVFRDLENPTLLEHVQTFAKSMARMREHLAQVQKIRYTYEQDAWFLEALDVYCAALTHLVKHLSTTPLTSRGFLALRSYLTTYVRSDRFRALVAEKDRVQAKLATVDYAIVIKDNGFTVRKYESEPDYSAVVEATFEKFKQGAPKDYRVTFSSHYPDMNHIEAQVLAFVARLYPGEFGLLGGFRERNRDYLDEVVARFDREVQFYVAYLEYIAGFRSAGLSLCYPKIAHGADKEIYDYEGFDLALARTLVAKDSIVVCNDFHLTKAERIIVVTGPNQGGKTTFARAFGQIHFLGALGCLVAGNDAKIFLFDKLFTHFEREENIDNLRGKLEHDLFRLRGIVDQASSSSVVIMNEIFTSTTIRDAIFLSKNIMERFLRCDLLGVWVTFIDELASFNQKTVSLVSTVVPENPAQRTFKIERRQADGLAYALAIAEKHHVTYRSLKERIPS
jgi:DNA mismatch repair ATPase MutS